MNICYYVSSHGYGHASRVCAVCNNFSADVRLFIRTAAPRAFFEAELRRSFSWSEGLFDCGCVQTDSITVDIEATVREYMTIAERNRSLLSAEAAWCRAQGIDCIVGDIPPFACSVAQDAGIPAVIVTNFTWFDIYAPYVAAVPSFGRYVEEVRNQYAMADLLIETYPALPMPFFKKRESVPVVARKGEYRRNDILKALRIAPEKHLALIYPGTMGLHGVAWHELERFSDWAFLGVYPLPGSSPNYYRVDASRFSYGTLSASVDLVVSKLGYSTVGECLVNGVPILYVPRSDFAEFPVLDKAVRQWGHGYKVAREDYAALKWERVLDHVVSGPKAEPMSNNGAALCAGHIERVARGQKRSCRARLRP